MLRCYLILIQLIMCRLIGFPQSEAVTTMLPWSSSVLDIDSNEIRLDLIGFPQSEDVWSGYHAALVSVAT